MQRLLLSSLLVAATLSGCNQAPTDPRLPLETVTDTPLPGAANRFDYQDIDTDQHHLVIAHMNDDAVVVASLEDGSVVGVIEDVPVARGVVVAPEIQRFFVTSSPNTLVIFDSVSLEIVDRVETGAGPDGVGWDAVDAIVAVSDQHDGALSLIANGGEGERTQVPLGAETGNVVFDTTRNLFWVTVVAADGPDQLMAIDPIAKEVTKRIDLPGCDGAHGLRLDPAAATALIACENNSTLARVPLDGAGALVSASTSSGPDVLAIDPDLGWIYVAAEGGDLKIFDIGQPGLTELDSEDAGPNAHSVAVDPATHRVFLPLEDGPVLRIMQPSGT